MVTFLVCSALAATLFVMAGLGLVIGAILWTVLLPIRLLLRLMFWGVGALLAIVVAPVLLVVLAVIALVALAAAAVAALVPLLPLLAVALIGWAVYRAVARRPSPAV